MVIVLLFCKSNIVGSKSLLVVVGCMDFIECLWEFFCVFSVVVGLVGLVLFVFLI